METITEDYVSFEIAKLLKEKGFNEHCFCINYPLPEGENHSIIIPNFPNNSMIPFTDEYKFCRYKEDFITIPTLQMTMKWLREVKNICISVDIKIGGREYYIAISDIRSGLSFGVLEDEICGTYEEACESAIKYCLENLI